jgi:hypothetical protein
MFLTVTQIPYCQTQICFFPTSAPAQWLQTAKEGQYRSRDFPGLRRICVFHTIRANQNFRFSHNQIVGAK